VEADLKPSRAAHRIVKQLEGDPVADIQLVEGRALLHIRAMKEHLARVREPNETVTLPNE
jgi:hypothetical protein